MSDPTGPEALARIRQAFPAPVLFAGHPHPNPKGVRRPPRRHVTAEAVVAIESMKSGTLLLRLEDGTSLRADVPVRTGITGVLRRLQKAGHPFVSTHPKHAVRTDRIEVFQEERPPLPSDFSPMIQSLAFAVAKPPAREDFPEVPTRAIDPAFVRWNVHDYGQEALLLEDVDVPRASVHRVRKKKAKTKTGFEVVLEGVADPVPIGEKAQESVIAALAERLPRDPPFEQLEYPVPDSEFSRTLRALRLVTMGGDEFWSVALRNPEGEEAVAAWERQKRDFMERFMIQTFDRRALRALFAQHSEPYRWVKAVLMRNVVWQVHQWLTYGLIDHIKDDEDPPVRLASHTLSDDLERRYNIRSIWYVFLKNLLDVFEHEEDKDVPILYDELGLLSRTEKLFRYADFGFQDRLRYRRALGRAHPHVILLVEKDGAGADTQALAEAAGVGHLILSGQPPTITMEYMTEDLAKRVDLKRQPVYLLGIVDFNTSGASILETARDDLEYYGSWYGMEHPVTAVNLIPPGDLDEYRIRRYRSPQVRFEGIPDPDGSDAWEKTAHYTRGSASYLKRVKQWHAGHAEQHPLFHDSHVLDPETGRVRETYYALELDHQPWSRIANRFYATLEELGIEPVPPPPDPDPEP